MEFQAFHEFSPRAGFFQFCPSYNFYIKYSFAFFPEALSTVHLAHFEIKKSRGANGKICVKRKLQFRKLSSGGSARSASYSIKRLEYSEQNSNTFFGSLKVDRNSTRCYAEHRNFKVFCRVSDPLNLKLALFIPGVEHCSNFLQNETVDLFWKCDFYSSENVQVAHFNNKWNVY